MSVVSPDCSAEGLRALFDAVEPLTVGLEEEVMLLDPATLDLAPRADDVLARFEGDARVKPELPAAQVELMTEPTRLVSDAAAQLAEARRDLAAACEGQLRFGAAGMHPFAAPLGELSDDDRYDHTRREYGLVARLQVVFAFQVHVAVGGADRTLAVHNALRSYLPEIAALGANAPYYCGRDSGMASVRPIVGRALPRQGIPPIIESWAAFEADLRWGVGAGSMASPGQWWWEVRPHPLHGTLEVRAPDAQATVEHGAAITAVVQSLVAWLSLRWDAGEPLAVAPGWRIEENRWSAARHGVEGTLADLTTGESAATGARLLALIDDLEPVAAGLGCASELAIARDLAVVNGAGRQRVAAGPHGDARAATGWLADVFVPPTTTGGHNAS